jgi:hypothetical protein
MAVTTDISPQHFYYERMLITSTAAGVMTSDANPPGFRMATAVDSVIRIPIEKPGENMGLMIMMSAVSSAAYYAQLDIAYANTTDPGWAGRNYAFSSGVPSTEANAWRQIISTAVVGQVTASGLNLYCVKLDTAKYACNFGGTSSAITDKQENFINIMVGQSTKSTVSSHNAMSQILDTVYVAAVSLPK